MPGGFSGFPVPLLGIQREKLLPELLKGAGKYCEITDGLGWGQSLGDWGLGKHWGDDRAQRLRPWSRLGVKSHKLKSPAPSPQTQASPALYLLYCSDVSLLCGFGQLANPL